MNRAIAIIVIVLSVAETTAQKELPDPIPWAADRFLFGLEERRPNVLPVLERFRGDIDAVLREVERRQLRKQAASSGVLKDVHFSHPRHQAAYADDLLNILVPDRYSPEKQFGLLIFMHGGGPGTKREYAWAVIADPAKDRYSYGLRQYFTNSQFVVVAPSAPWNEKSSARWNLPETDRYIAAVIDECHYRFNIDRDRVFLGGQSMGGFGAYHLCQRLNDRLAGGVLYAGAWSSARWENMMGTPLFIRHGINDAKPPGPDGKGGRPRYTDVFYAQSASRLLKKAGAEHVYFEDQGDHSIKAAGESVRALVKWMEKQKRDPYAPRVIAQTPRGWKATTDTPTPHSRWITIHETSEGTLPFDQVQRTGPGPRWKESKESFEKQGFKLGDRNVRAAKVDAVNHGDNRFTIKTRNVKRFSLWLHPKMVNFSKPIHLHLNGKDIARTARPSLLDALRSYQRREDWGLVYHAELVLDGDAPR